MELQKYRLPNSPFPLVRLPAFLAGAALATALLLAGCIADTGSPSKSEPKAAENTEENTLAVAAVYAPPKSCPTWLVNDFDYNIRRHDTYWHEQQNIAYRRLQAELVGRPQYLYWKGQYNNAYYSVAYWHQQSIVWAKRNWPTLKNCRFSFHVPLWVYGSQP
jgi:hypothetical protein